MIIFLLKRKNGFFKYIAVRKGMSLSEMEVPQMQKAMCGNTKPLDTESLDEELIDTLIAISVVSKRIASNLRKIKDEGDKENESHE